MGQGSPTTMPVATVVIATTGNPALEGIVGILLAAQAEIEVIVMVDAPELSAPAVLPSLHRDPRVRVVVNEANIGLTRSLGRALELARAPIVIRNDDDDEPSPDRVDSLLAHFAAEPDCDLVFSYAHGIDESSGRTWLIDGPTDDAGIKAKLARRNFIVHSSLSFRRDRICAIGGYDATFRYAQDYDLYLRAVRAGYRFGCVARPLVSRSYHPHSITVGRRRRQMLYSFAARLINEAERRGGEPRPWLTIATYLKLILIPDWLRAMRRRIGRGR